MIRGRNDVERCGVHGASPRVSTTVRCRFRGGAFVYLWNSADWEWILIGLIALIYFTFASGLDRSSYAVFGAIGLLLAWSHFVEKWTDTTVERLGAS